MPVIQEPWIQIAGDPNLGQLTHPKQQPVDFGIWQAADGTWQLWSCIRGTKEPGHPHRASRMGDVQMTWAITASPPSPNLSSRAAISKIAGTKHHEQHPYPALAFTASSLPPHH